MTRRKKQQGQALIESCLVMIPLLLMIVGIVDFGQFLFFHEAMTDRARPGARYAAVSPYDATPVTNMVLYNSPPLPTGPPAFYGFPAPPLPLPPTPPPP